MRRRRVATPQSPTPASAAAALPPHKATKVGEVMLMMVPLGETQLIRQGMPPRDTLRVVALNGAEKGEDTSRRVVEPDKVVEKEGAMVAFKPLK